MRTVNVMTLRTVLVLLAVAVLVLSTLAELAYQALVGVPGEVTADQSATARRILTRQMDPVLDALAAGQPGLAEPSLLRETGDPDLLGIALVNPSGKIAAATHGDWLERRADSLIPALGPLADQAQAVKGGVRIHVDRPRRTLTAVLPVPDSTLAAESPPDIAGTDASMGAGPWLLFLELDQTRARSAAWARRLSARASLSWLALSSLVALIAALLAQRWLGQPLSRLTAQAQRIAEGDLSADAGLVGRGELAAPAAGLSQAAERVRNAEAEQQNTETRWVDALEDRKSVV